MNARQSERKSTDSFSLSIRVVLYLNKESETACNPLINSCAIICFKRIGAQGRNSFIAADTPTRERERDAESMSYMDTAKPDVNILLATAKRLVKFAECK